MHRDAKRLRRGAPPGERGVLTLSYWCFQPAVAMEQLSRLKVLALHQLALQQPVPAL